MNKLEDRASQKLDVSEFALKFAGAVLAVLISTALIAGARVGNMALSLVWPILLLPLLSAFKALVPSGRETRAGNFRQYLKLTS